MAEKIVHINYVRIAGALVLAITIQVVLGHIWGRAHFYLNPLTIVVLFAAIQGSPIAGMISGSLAGVFQDSFSGQLIGVSSFSKTLIGYAMGVLNIKLVIRSVFFLAPLIFLASCAEMLFAVLLDRIVQVRPIVTGSSILTVACGNALIGTTIIKLGDQIAHAKKK